MLKDMTKEMVISVSINSSSCSICSFFDSLLHPFHKPDKHSKVLRIAVGTEGVDSVKFDGDDKSKIVVKGNGVDPVKLMKKLRKKMGYANLEKMGDVKAPKKEDPPKPVPVLPPAIQIIEAPSQHHEPVCCSIM